MALKASAILSPMAPHYDPTDIRAIDDAQTEQAERDRLAQESEDGDVRWLMGSKRGRRIVWRLLDRAGVFRISFNTNAMAMAFAEGNRNEGLRMIALIHRCCPDLYPTMLREAANERPGNADGRNDH